MESQTTKVNQCLTSSPQATGAIALASQKGTVEFRYTPALSGKSKIKNQKSKVLILTLR